MATLLKAAGETLEVSPRNGKHFTLSEMYGLLGCSLIEIFDLAYGRILVCDEEAKLREDWDINLKATELFREGRMSHSEYREYLKKQCQEDGTFFIDASMDTLDCIAGDALVCRSDEIR